ncbi:MAG: hypothetical protein IAE86_22625 [Burkholderiaceae bacterium]|nr:hypothetical protein [Burkholderiaceae bacterium]
MMLNSNRLASALLVIGLASFAGGALATTPHSTDDHGAAVQELTLDQGKRWPTDEPLRQGMNDIRTAMAAAFPQIHMGQFTSEQYGALAARVRERIDHIFANCRLPEEADAQLHVILTDIGEGADAMGSQSDRLGGAMQVIQAIEAYGRHFDHPDWGKPQSL